VARQPQDEAAGRGIEVLAGEARRGDRAAAQELLRRVLPRVRNLCRYLVRGDGDVDDMAQQAMVAILRGLPTYQGTGTFQAWADRITAREAIRMAKKLRAERDARRHAAPDLRVVRGPDAKPDDYLKRREVARLLDGLPDEQRHVVVLHHVMGLSVPEVARELDLPFDTAKSRLRLAMKKLRDRAGER